jgi:hypothetical protein
VVDRDRAYRANRSNRARRLCHGLARVGLMGFSFLGCIEIMIFDPEKFISVVNRTYVETSCRRPGRWHTLCPKAHLHTDNCLRSGLRIVAKLREHFFISE